MNVDDQPDRQPDADLTDAWVYAANCRLYENDPGPAELNIASRIEPMWVSRAEAFRDLHARLLLEELDADAARIAVLARQITAETKQKPPPEIAEIWNIAGELCRRAAAIIDEAGAATDARARRRLLAATTHLTRSVVLGQWVPAYQEELDNELLQALKDTEQGPD